MKPQHAVSGGIAVLRSFMNLDWSKTGALMSLTVDGSLDGVAHLVEVYFGAPAVVKDQARRTAEVSLELIIKGLIQAKKDPSNAEARTLLGLGTDLGGYAIMIGGTSGAHLTSFSLVDVLSHGRPCALMNPHYSVFFSTAAEEQLRVIGGIYKKHGYIEQDIDSLSGRKLGLAVAGGMVNFSKFLDFPTRLSEVPGISRAHIDKCLTAAKNPQLDRNLETCRCPSMPNLWKNTCGLPWKPRGQENLKKLKPCDPRDPSHGLWTQWDSPHGLFHLDIRVHQWYVYIVK
jgi:alcohol dehydrogenase